MENRCRCCLKTTINLLEILIDEEEKFQNCTGNKQFSKNDGLSQSCCRYCYKKIHDIYIFQEQCKNSDLFLKNLLLNNNIKNETNEINNLLEIQYNDETLKKEKLEDTNIIVNPNDEIFEIVNYAENENLEQNSQITVNAQSSLNCNKCKKSFTSSKNLKLHISKIHKTDEDHGIACDGKLTENISFKCKFCHDVFKKHSMLLKHLRTEHLPNSELVTQEKFNECDNIGKAVKDENMQILYESKSVEYTIKCNDITAQVGEKLNNKNKFRQKYRNLIQFEKYYCHLCGIKFPRKNYLVTHFHAKHLKIMKFTCKLCWKGFASYDVFHNHLIKIHLKHKNAPTKDEMVKYLITNHDTEFSNLLWKDIKFPDISKINEIKNNYECKLCDKPLNSKISLKFHFSSVHLKLTNIYHKCNICSKIFRYKYGLIQHRKNHKFIVKQICENTNFISIQKFGQDYIENCLVNNRNKLKSSFHQWPQKITMQNEIAIPTNHYNCNYCDIKFGAKRYLKVHMKRKHANAIIHPSQFECSVCNSIFTKQYLLRNHMKDVHPEKYAQLATASNRYNCNYCDITFGARRYLQVHMRRKHADVIILPNQFDCSVCNNIFPKQYLLRKHIKDNHPEEYIQLAIPSNRFNCNYCDNTFGEKRYLKGHMRRHHPNVIIPPNKIECSICNNVFTKQYLLRNHMKNDHLEEYTQLAIPSTRYNCDYCDNTFGAKRYLNVHMRRKHGNSIIPNQFECTICNNIFTKQYLYTNHMKDNHPDEYAQLIRVNCKICNKSYSTKSIQGHLKIHENRPKNIQCPECGRTFFSQSSFNYHQKTHSNEKPFKCTFDRCSKAFLTNFQLVSHFNTHADIKKPKRYHCHYCGKGCASTTEIKVHLRIHTKERPFKCTLCDKGFLTKTHLRNHSYTHTGEKNYKCKEDGCKNSYVSISSLKKHYYTVHFPEDQKKYQCDLCFKKFAQRTFLNQHRKAHGKIARAEKN